MDQFTDNQLHSEHLYGHAWELEWFVEELEREWR